MQKLTWRRIVEGSDITYRPTRAPKEFVDILIINRDPANKKQHHPKMNWEYRVVFRHPDLGEEDILGIAETLKQAQDIVNEHVNRLVGA